MRRRWMLAAAAAFGLAMVTLVVPSSSIAPYSGGRSAFICAPRAKKANLNFTLKGMDGEATKLSDYAGKVLLVDFWATWCVPCQLEIPGFVNLYSNYKSRGFEIVGIVVLDEFAKARPFARQFKMNYPVLDGNDRADVEAAFGPMWGLLRIPVHRERAFRSNVNTDSADAEHGFRAT